MSNWRKSTYSGGANSNCVEVGGWRTSTRCEGGACIEVGSGPAVIGVRDTKDREGGPVLTFRSGQWAAFVAEVKRMGGGD